MERVACASISSPSCSTIFKEVFGINIVRLNSAIRRPALSSAMQCQGKIYVRTDARAQGFVQMAGHELLHQIRKDSPELYVWLETQATHYLRTDAEARYGQRLEAVGADLATLDVREEILADVTGDARADPRFLETLATQNPSKFRQFLQTVLNWLMFVEQNRARP
jgi:hypothetical protein